MSLWRRTAIERFPQLHRAIADAESAGWVWYVLRHALEDAYRQKPLDEKLVADVYEYASWCLHHRSMEVRTAVVLWFYEGLCVDDLLRPDMARWMSQSDFDLLAFAWTYVLTGENLRAFQQEFAARKAEVEGVASRHQQGLVKRLNKAKPSAA
ncbi:MAG: hypothetical protein JO250_04915 [Armatimonadetes bacterium]|nr:hypothetical protein [Armatimonadota bacterium]